MKYILFIFIIAFTDYVFGQGDAPALMQGQNQVSKQVGAFIKVPNQQITKLNAATGLIETGNNNILENPGLEHAEYDFGWVVISGTSSLETTEVFSGVKSMKIVASASPVEVFNSSPVGSQAFADGVQLLGYMRVKTDTTGLKVCSRVEFTTSTTNCVDVQANNKWGLYKVPFIGGNFYHGIVLTSQGNNVSGTTYVDDAFVGAVDLQASVDQSRIAGESYFAGTTGCAPSRTNTAIGAFGTDADCVGPTIVTSTMGSWQTTDSDLIRQTVNNLPAGTYKAKFIVAAGSAGADWYALAINDGTTTCEPFVAGNNNANTSSTFRQNIVECTFTYASSGNRVFELYGSSASSAVQVDGQRSSPRASTKFILEYFGNNQIYSASCGANCVDTFTAKVSESGVVSGENVDWINGNAVVTSTSLYTMTWNSGIFTTSPNCNVTPTKNVTNSFLRFQGEPTSSGGAVFSVSDTGVATAVSYDISCSKTGADFNATRNIIGQFNEVMVTPNVSKPKTCYYAFGGASATLASPTECTTGTCTEVVDTCGTASPPAFSSAGVYIDFTFASGTWANTSLVSCDCKAYDTTSGLERDCRNYFITPDQTWASNASGGFVTNIYSTNSTSSPADSYVSLECKGQAP